MVVFVSAIICLGVCVGLVCKCTMRSKTPVKWGLHDMSKSQWTEYFNSGGDI